VTDQTEPSDSFLGDFTPGYIRRRAALGPKQGTKDPWRAHQNYRKDFFMFKFGKLEDNCLEFR
jgi:hypothetical protein